MFSQWLDASAVNANVKSLPPNLKIRNDWQGCHLRCTRKPAVPGVRSIKRSLDVENSGFLPQM
jgi:hypothetical protein